GADGDQCLRQCTQHIGQATGLDEWKDLGPDMQDLHVLNFSSMPRVTRVMPFSERRKRCVSSSTSSPMTMSSGIETPRSMTQRVSRARRPTCTPGSSTDQLTVEYECTRTLENS